MAHNSAPALSNDGSTLYVAVNDGNGFGFATGYLLALDSHTLATIAAVRLKDPSAGRDATMPDDGTSSPTVGPDGDVYFGVLENPFGPNHFRGWLLHFDAMLQPSGAPGAFGWDDTASIVPASMVAVVSRHVDLPADDEVQQLRRRGRRRRQPDRDPRPERSDDRPDLGRDGDARGPHRGGSDTGSGAGPAFPNAVREWCINTAAVDPVTKSILANSEDGKLYRWDMTTDALTESIVLTAGLVEAYTPTLIGPDGTVYAINDATLFAVGQ